MRRIFSVGSIVERYIAVEVAIMRGLEEAGIAPRGCASELARCARVLPEEVYSMEAVLGHDIASLAYIIGERCGECGRYAHLGATSYDVVDTAWALILRDALEILRGRLRRAIEMLTALARENIDAIMPGRTHGQHALPITLGFKLANYVYELARSYERLSELGGRLIRCKISGAVGTMAAWRGRGLAVEETACRELGLEPHAISTQVAPRDGFAELLSALAILASQLDRLALEVRELSRTEIGELSEGVKRVGSSTMPHKRNPVTAERISGLARVVRGLAVAALENIPLMHERDLTNSSSERILIPHSVLIVDQMLVDTINMLENLEIDREAMQRNLELTGGAIMAESVMIKLVEKGIPRHQAHRILSEIASRTRGRSFREALLENETIARTLKPEEIEEALDHRKYLGNYRELVERAIAYAERALTGRTGITR